MNSVSSAKAVWNQETQLVTSSIHDFLQMIARTSPSESQTSTGIYRHGCTSLRTCIEALLYSLKKLYLQQGLGLGSPVPYTNIGKKNDDSFAMWSKSVLLSASDAE